MYFTPPGMSVSLVYGFGNGFTGTRHEFGDESVMSIIAGHDFSTVFVWHMTSIISMAIHRKSWRPKIEYPPVEFYYFSKKQFEAGIDKIIIRGHKISIYCKEKTICDCFRYRNRMGIDIVKEGLSKYLKRKDRNLEKLLEYAEICRVKTLMEIWINAMI